LCLQFSSIGEDDRCLYTALPVRHSLQMSTQTVTTRATTATCTGCVRRGMSHKTPFSGRGSRNDAKDDPRPNILQLNTEGSQQTRISVNEQLACRNKAFIFFLQETHCTTADKIVISNFPLAGSVMSRNHGLATFIHERLEWSLVDQSPELSETEWLCVDVAGYKIINVYKSPRSRFTPTAIPTIPHPSLYVGDFNCEHVNWGNNKTSLDGESLDSWATSNNLVLLYDPKETASCASRRWNIGNTPDLAFAGFDQDSRLPDRRVLEKFSRSQHQLSLIKPPRLKVPVHSNVLIGWNFSKADWKRFSYATGVSVERLPPLDT